MDSPAGLHIIVAMEGSSTPTCNSVARAFEILELMDACPKRWTVSAIARRLQIPKSTAHVLAVTLEHNGYLTRTKAGAGYVLGLKAYALGRGLIPTLVLPKIALEPMRSLSEITRLTSHLAVLEGEQAIYIQKSEGPGLIRFDTYIGKHTNLHCTAVGKVLLAWGRPEFVREYVAKAHYTRHTEHTITTAAVLRRELQLVRNQGFALDNQEEELQVRCMAVPVSSPYGECLGALGICGTTGQLHSGNEQFLWTVLRKTAIRISEQIPKSSHIPAAEILAAIT